MMQGARQNSQGEKVGDFLAGLLVGGLVGAGFALFNAPRSGMATRQQLREKAGDLHNRTARVVADAQSRVEGVTDRVAERAIELQTSGTAAFREAQKHMHRAAEETKQAAEAATTI